MVRAVVGGVVLLGSVQFAVVVSRSRPGPELSAEPPPPRHVQAVVVQPVPVTRQWEGYGTARAMAAAEVAAEVAGRVIHRPAAVEPGAAIRAGELIMALDPEDYQAQVAAIESRIAATRADLESLAVEESSLRRQVEAAEEEAELRRRDYERAAAALERGAGSRTDVERRLVELNRATREAIALREAMEQVPARRKKLEAQTAELNAQLRAAAHDLSRTEIRSPLDGLVQRVEVEEGEWVRAGQVVARVVDLRRLEVPLKLPVSAMATVQVGDEVELRADSPLEERWRGSIARIAPEADPDTRTVTLYVELEQRGEGAGQLRPGQFVVGRVRAGASETRLVVPRRAVVRERVLVAEEADAEGRARVRPVAVQVLYYVEGRYPMLDADEREWAVVDAALRAGETVIVSNLDELGEGSVVRVGGAREVARDGGGPGDRREGGL